MIKDTSTLPVVADIPAAVSQPSVSSRQFVPLCHTAKGLQEQ